MAVKDSYGKCPVKWFIDATGTKRWMCTSHISSFKHKEDSEKCWYVDCPGRSMCGYPYTDEEIKERHNQRATKVVNEVEDQLSTCNNYECSNKVAHTRKRYCSDKCRKDKARIDYEARNPGRSRKRRN
jgi:hypothetical protein